MPVAELENQASEGDRFAKLELARWKEGEQAPAPQPQTEPAPAPAAEPKVTQLTLQNRLKDATTPDQVNEIERQATEANKLGPRLQKKIAQRRAQVEELAPAEKKPDLSQVAAGGLPARPPQSVFEGNSWTADPGGGCQASPSSPST